MAFLRKEELVRLSLEGPAEVSWFDKLEATWLLTSETFSDDASTSRSIIGFIFEDITSSKHFTCIVSKR
jgi:hypothetical protein